MKIKTERGLGPRIVLGHGGPLVGTNVPGEGTRGEEWKAAAGAYNHLIEDPQWDSMYLRDWGLISNVVGMVGDCSDATLLDAGTGTGWLFAQVRPRASYACDLIVPSQLPVDVKFERQDVSQLSYSDGMFDIIVASLLLIYCKNLDLVCRELRRVAKAGHGRLVVALMHPYFYRTGEARSDGSFLVTQDLARAQEFSIKIADQIGPFEYFYRPLPDYINALIQAGWQIQELADWFIDWPSYQELATHGVGSRIKRTGRVPMFTFIHCRAS